MRIEVGDSFTKKVHFDAASISAFAYSTGDMNPLHHDPAYAATTRFGGIIASGSHVSALQLGMVAGYFADKGTNVGLDFTVRFRAPIPVDTTMTLRWTVISVTPKASLKGDIVTLAGEVVDPNGTVAVSATATAVLFDDETGDDA